MGGEVCLHALSWLSQLECRESGDDGNDGDDEQESSFWSTIHDTEGSLPRDAPSASCRLQDEVMVVLPGEELFHSSQLALLNFLSLCARRFTHRVFSRAQ